MKVQRAAKVHTHSIMCNEIWPIANKITLIETNKQEVWRINFQEISSNGSLISANKLYDSARDGFLIFANRKLTYTELTDGIL